MALALRGKQFLALDWNRKELRMVVVRQRADGVDLLKAVSSPIPEGVRTDDAAALGAFIKQAMAEAKIGVTRALLGVSRDQVVINTLNLPPTPAEELPSIVAFQIVKELPFSVDQATLDFAVCGEFDPKLASSVLVAAVRNEDLDFYRQVASQAGLSVELVGLRPHSNLVSVLANAPELTGRNVLVVEAGPNLTEIDIIRKGVLAFSRAATMSLIDVLGTSDQAFADSRIVTPGTPERSPDEMTRQAVSSLMVDIIRSVEAYRATDPTLSVDEIVVCGATGLEPQLAEALAARFAARAELYAPDKALNLTPQRARELRGFSAAIGLALGQGAQGLGQFDFLHPKKPISKRTLRLRKMPVVAATVILFIGSGVMYYMRFISPKWEAIAELKEQVNDKRKDEKKIKEFKAQVEALEDWMENEHRWPEVLLALTEVFPPQKEAYVTRADFETRPAGRGGKLQSVAKIHFRTASLGTVNNLTNRVSNVDFISIVPGKETYSPTEDGYTNDTDMTANLPPRNEWLKRRAARIAAEASAAQATPTSKPAEASPDAAKPEKSGGGA